MPIAMVIMGFAVVGYILCTMLAAYTYGPAKIKTEFGLCVGGIVVAIVAFGTIFWMPGK